MPWVQVCGTASRPWVGAPAERSRQGGGPVKKEWGEGGFGGCLMVEDGGNGGGRWWL